MGLLQKKVEGLEQSVKTASRRETEWEGNMNKVCFRDYRRGDIIVMWIWYVDEESREAVGTIRRSNTKTERNDFTASTG